MSGTAPSSVALITTVSAPTPASSVAFITTVARGVAVGVPEKVRVVALKASQPGSAPPPSSPAV